MPSRTLLLLLGILALAAAAAADAKQGNRKRAASLKGEAESRGLCCCKLGCVFMGDSGEGCLPKGQRFRCREI